MYTLGIKNNKTIFIRGMKDGIPIGLGYLAVSFSLGIAAKNAGLSAVQGLLASFLCSASAGEYAGFTVIAADASYISMVLATLVANIRYLLMGCALSQRLDAKAPLRHRLLMAFHLTDEIFGIAISRKTEINPYYSFGAALTAAPPWAVGTMLGVIAGSVLPNSLVSAFSVALYGMFLAVIIPKAKEDRTVFAVVVISFALSLTASLAPMISQLDEGIRTVILTLLISTAAAIFCPVKEEKEAEYDA